MSNNDRNIEKNLKEDVTTVGSVGGAMTGEPPAPSKVKKSKSLKRLKVEIKEINK